MVVSGEKNCRSKLAREIQIDKRTALRVSSLVKKVSRTLATGIPAIWVLCLVYILHSCNGSKLKNVSGSSALQRSSFTRPGQEFLGAHIIGIISSRFFPAPPYSFRADPTCSQVRMESCAKSLTNLSP